ncbi:MAG TPA: TetR/AcrR family transcriptional regulator [Thermoanaerobaculia bacterium]|jgi:AcrR family transcriptional regulator|nr:TetR/AcrR family transcriptional regulator [Thermoanaerobaculia bacterium]
MGKGAETRERILDQAVRIASRDGLEGLTIGTLSSELGLSKSGLFAHFGSKDELQVQVLQAAVGRFTEVVIRPALAAPRGEPRIRALFENWLAWSNAPDRGCILVGASTEFDDRPGPQRDTLTKAFRDRSAFMAKAARLAIEAGHFRADLDPEQFAFDLDAIVLGYHNAQRLMRNPKAGDLARGSFERLLAFYKA